MPDGARALQFFAALWLWLEAVLRWFGPVFFLALVLLNAAWWGGFTKLSGAWAAIVPLGFWLAAAGVLIKDFRRVPWPNRARIQTRLEEAGALHHQPLQTLNDAPIGRNPLADALWQHHQLNAARRLAFLRWPKMRTDYAARDPLAFRWLLGLLAILAVLYSPNTVISRAAAAFIPAPAALFAALGPGAFHVYLTPPAYTGLAPIYLSSANPVPRKLTLPIGTEIWASVSGGAVKPVFDTGMNSRKLTRVQNGFFELQDTLMTTTHLQLRQGLIPLLNLPLRLQADVPPDVSVREVSSPAPGYLQVNLCARDLYALRNITLHWQGQMSPDLQGDKEIFPTGKEFCGLVMADVAADPLAGQEASLWVSAKNSAGLEKETEKQTITLPQKTFQNSWAARLATARQSFALHPNPATRNVLNQVLSALGRTKLPLNVYLSIQNACRQLAAGGDANSGLMSDLWQISERLEEGPAADLAANWRASRQTLLTALSDWKVTEDTILNQQATTQEAWEAYARAHREDPTHAEKIWEDIAAQIASGERDSAIETLQQMDEIPFENIVTHEDDEKINSATADALRHIRARLADPNTPEPARDYLERLIRP